MWRLRTNLTIVLLLSACTAREVPPELVNPIVNARTSALPQARPAEEPRLDLSPPEIVRHGERKIAPASKIFPAERKSGSEWEEQRARALETHQRNLDQYHANKEYTHKRPLPRVRVGE